MSTIETVNHVDRAIEIGRVVSDELKAMLNDKIGEIYMLAVKHGKIPVTIKFQVECMEASYIRVAKMKLKAKAPDGVETDGDDKEFDFATPDMLKQ